MSVADGSARSRRAARGSSSCLFRLAAACLGVTLVACGGGGGGGGGSPTAPGPPPPPLGPAPDTSPLTDQTLYGQVVGLFASATNFTNSTVRVVGGGEDTVRVDNSFRIEPVEAGEYTLSILGAGFLNRKIRIDMIGGGPNQIPALDLAEDASFNLDAFDEIYRENGAVGTSRMVKRPRFLIDQSDFDSLPGSDGVRLTTEIELAITGPMAQATAPFLNRATITSRTNLANVSSPCNLSEGDVHWHAERQLEGSDGTLLLGRAWWCWSPSQNTVFGGILYLDDSAGPGTILHELVHLLGSADHLESTPGASVIGAPRSLTALSLMDEQHLRFLYHRPPGVRSPDNASNLDPSDLIQLSSGGAMEVRCDIYPDGTIRIERAYPGGFAR